jgi:cyclopropane fatty-acyl-phospholipid synthase-like methyltransferase
MNTKEFYQSKFEKYGVSPKSLLWKSKGAAHQRFRQFWHEIDFTNKKVLDVGCGFGEFGKFLLKRYEGVDYTGVDVVPEFIENAKRLVPEGKFKTFDLMGGEKLQGSFDVVVASGVLNGNHENNVEYRKKAIRVMFDAADKILAFNMLGSHPQPENDNESNVWYADSLEILDYCMSMTKRVVMRHNYHPKDFTIFMYKSQKTSKII